MSKWDREYLSLCKEILIGGKEVENRTGINTIKIPYKSFALNLQDEFPILTTKKVGYKWAILEMLWIYQVQSNDVNWLNERGITIWDEWRIDDDGIYRVPPQGGKPGYEKYFGEEYAGTIGTAYGYITKKYQLTQKLIETLKENPNDRRMVMSLWQDEYLDTAVLPSCVWNTMWDVTDGKLNAIVTQRSCDVALGLPFNVTQYAALVYMLAHTTGLKPGMLYWSTKDAHIYVNQVKGIMEQIRKYELLGDFKAPTFEMNPEINDFFMFDNSKELKDIKIKNYKNHGPIKMDVAI